MADNINPNHYKECSLECIEVMRMVIGVKGVAYFCIGNAFKYLWRYKNKNGKEDLEKALWYIHYVRQEIALSLDCDAGFMKKADAIFMEISRAQKRLKDECYVSHDSWKDGDASIGK